MKLRKLTKTFALLVLGIILFSFQQIKAQNYCSASYTHNTLIDSSNGTISYSTVFTNQSIGNNLSYLWNFGDSSTSTLQSPIKNYETPGLYLVCLTALNYADLNCYSVYCNYVKIGLTDSIQVPPCLASFGYNIVPDSLASDSSVIDTISKKVQFIDMSIGNNLSYLWDFGDSTTSSLQSPLKTYQTPGSYIVCLKVSSQSDSNCYNESCAEIRVGLINPVPCLASFGYDIVPDSLASDSSVIDTISKKVQFIDLSIGNNLSYLWDFGDSTTSNLQSPLKTYQTPGLYIVCLKVSSQSDSNCYNETCAEIRVGIIDSNQVICKASFLRYSFLDSLELDSSMIDTTLRKVHFLNLSTGDNLSYFWNFGDSTYSSLESPTKVFQTQRLYNVCLTIWNQWDRGCFSVKCKEVNANEIDSSQGDCKALFDYSNDSTNTYSFVNQSEGKDLSYQWDFGDFTGSTMKSPTKTYQKPGVYDVWLFVLSKADSGCVSRTSKRIVYGSLSVNDVEKTVNLKLNNIYPIPASDEVSLEIYSLEAGKLNILISDLRGKALIIKENEVESGDNKVKIDISGLSAGAYFVEVSNGKNKVFKKIIK